MSHQELSERNKRMKRAIDLSLKHTYLAHDVQKVEGTPYLSYLEIDEVCRSACRAHALPLLLFFIQAASLVCRFAAPSSLPQVRRDQQERLENK